MFYLFRRKRAVTPLIFVHIPKTAGTSFRSAMYRYFGKRHVCHDYRGEAKLCDRIVLDNINGRLMAPAFKSQFNEIGYSALTGHIPSARYADQFPSSFFVSFVREPISRLRSLFAHKKRHAGLKCDFMDFALDPRNQNVQTRLLAGMPWPSMGGVGVTERYSDSLKCINDCFEAGIVELTRNTAPLEQEGVSLSDGDLSVLSELNSLDLNLYRQVNTYLDYRLEALRDGYDFIRAWYTVSDKRKLSLTALPGSHVDSLTFDVLLKGKKSISVSADISKNGNVNSPLYGEYLCEVSVDLDELHHNEDIEVRISATDQPIIQLSEKT